ncbi:hypothetical protein GCM10011360_17130 [Primorskyibacter flagellatus]|uniref:Dihydroorotate dehydrogenase n=1 Tax=Primorskyibacter flagellatus TaxID=1387277 RepID=A0A917EEN5_9RHOB|nr:hypothetical protein [Primorskyibacter flagellatus]GGE29643.1 hypothetical protein GCM10011360_17130 [Primorskyibacter flagellatus]
MTDHDRKPDDLDIYFDAARSAAPALSPAALDRMTAQALAVQKEFAAPPVARRAPRRGLLGQLLATLGGWPAVAGLATAGVAGIWIGATPPAMLINIAVDVGAVSDTAEDDLYLVDTQPAYVLSLDLTEGS